MKFQSNTHVLSFLRFSVNAASMVVFGAGLVVLLGWMMDIPTLRSIMPGLPSIRFNTALSLFLMGGSIWLLQNEEAGTARKRVGKALASLVLLISLLTLSEYLFRWNLGIDELLIRDPDSPADLFPGRMSPIAVLCSVLSSTALLLIGSRIYQYFSLGVFVLSLVAIMDFLFDFQGLFRNAQNTYSAVQTAVAFLILSLALLAARPTRGMMKMLVSDLPGSKAMRLLLPAIIMLTILMGWLVEEAERLGFLDTSKDSIILVILLIFVYSPLIYFSAKNINQAEERLLDVNRLYASELERRVEERTAELKHASRAKDEFLATMSHELRTPLSSILGFSEILLEQKSGPLDGKQQQAVQLITSSGLHLLNLINDILEVSRIEAGKLDLHPETVRIKEVCESSLDFIRESARKKSISLEFHSGPSIATLQADPQRLKQILVNLLSNAVKFTPEKGRVTLEVNTNAEKDQIHFSVTDTGIGIAPNNLKKLFTPFTQLDSSLSREYEGTGLGLVLVYKFTELHGGSVQVESEMGKGSRFTINLPWGKDLMAQREAIESDGELLISKQAEVSNIPSEQRFDRGVVLLADDNMANTLTIGDYLESYGYQIVVAHNGLEAIEMAEEIHPNIILMDIQMPAMDGMEAIRRLRANAHFVSTPIVALTALAMPGDRERCLEAGANEYMSKPASLKTLVKTISQLLRRA